MHTCPPGQIATFKPHWQSNFVTPGVVDASLGADEQCFTVQIGVTVLVPEAPAAEALVPEEKLQRAPAAQLRSPQLHRAPLMYNSEHCTAPFI